MGTANIKSQKPPLRILHLEDDPADSTLIRSTLEAGGVRCTMTSVENKAQFAEALERGDMDLVLSDYALPSFDGLAALDMARARRPDLPFILVSGTLGEELAIESLKRGATDYVLKDRLSRLVPAIKRAVEEVAERGRRKHAEAQFIEAQKMEVVGQLAGGVAHDFNNIIAIIMGYSDLMAQKIAAEPTLKNHLEAIRAAATRAAGLTRQLLVFSRKQAVQPVVLSLNEAINGAETMLRRLIDENIELKFSTAKDAGRIKADPGYVGQVLMNLVINARDAMPRGGQLQVQTSNVTLNADFAKKHPDVTAGDYVMFSVTDTGTGMTPEVKAHLFEAFFTTKPKGKGTGLGLLTCHTIVEQSGGYIEVDSELGRGTTFKVYFPRVDAPVEISAAAAASPLPRGSEAILIVEDDPAVRQLARRVLESQGYEILTAANGEEGLRVAREHKGTLIHLVVTDVVMPQMGGHDMARNLQSMDPDLKILFTSGYTDDAIVHHGVLDPGVAFLPKPYTTSTLTRKVREILDDHIRP